MTSQINSHLQTVSFDKFLFNQLQIHSYVEKPNTLDLDLQSLDKDLPELVQQSEFIPIPQCHLQLDECCPQQCHYSYEQQQSLDYYPDPKQQLLALELQLEKLQETSYISSADNGSLVNPLSYPSNLSLVTPLFMQFEHSEQQDQRKFLEQQQQNDLQAYTYLQDHVHLPEDLKTITGDFEKRFDIDAYGVREFENQPRVCAFNNANQLINITDNTPTKTISKSLSSVTLPIPILPSISTPEIDLEFSGERAPSLPLSISLPTLPDHGEVLTLSTSLNNCISNLNSHDCNGSLDLFSQQNLMAKENSHKQLQEQQQLLKNMKSSKNVIQDFKSSISKKVKSISCTYGCGKHYSTDKSLRNHIRQKHVCNRKSILS